MICIVHLGSKKVSKDSLICITIEPKLATAITIDDNATTFSRIFSFLSIRTLVIIHYLSVSAFSQKLSASVIFTFTLSPIFPESTKIVL